MISFQFLKSLVVYSSSQWLVVLKIIKHYDEKDILEKFKRIEELSKSDSFSDEGVSLSIYFPF